MENKLIDLSKEFAKNIVKTFVNEKRNKNADSIFNQIIRSGTSIGANIFEANYGASRLDFINKLQIAQKECFETSYWLEIIKDAELFDGVICDELRAKCDKIRVILTASIKTAKEKI